MKVPLKSRPALTVQQALEIAAQVAPEQPPARVTPQTPPTAAPDTATTLNLRVRRSTVAALEAQAREKGLTMKQVVAQALQAAGIAVAPADLEDRTPRRK